MMKKNASDRKKMTFKKKINYYLLIRFILISGSQKWQVLLVGTTKKSRTNIVNGDTKGG